MVSEQIVRLAAKGDGATESGRHFPGAVPGDHVTEGGELLPGPHRAIPPCRHFGRCGGCQLQHCDDSTLAQFVTDRVVNAASGHGLAPSHLLPTHLSPPRTRRRATLHAIRFGKNVAFGFHEAGSHRIVDMRECHVLRPELFAVVEPLRKLLHKHRERRAVDVHLTLGDQGVDCLIKGLDVEGLSAHEDLLAFARERKLARLSLDGGWGAEPIWEPEPVTVSFEAVPVTMPAGAFLQATLDGEQVLQDDVAQFVGKAQRIADLFAGLGTLSVPLAARGRNITAFEADKAAHLASRQALSRAPGNNTAIHRDLFRAPLQPDELRSYDAVILDPPRAGARAQIERLAASTVPRIAYVSCNPASWARDARTLLQGGYRLEMLRPVGQFRWSTHVELTSLFIR